MNKAYANIE